MVIVGIWVGVCCGYSMQGGGQIFFRAGVGNLGFPFRYVLLPSHCMQMMVRCASSKRHAKKFVYEFLGSDAKLQICTVLSVWRFLIFAIDPEQT